MKPPVGSFPYPTSSTDAATRSYVDDLKRKSASGDYIFVYLSTDMTSALSPGDPILYDTVSTQRGELSLDTVTNIGRISGLKAGRTYLLQATARHLTDSGGFASFTWYDVTGASTIGTHGISYAQNNAGAGGEEPVAYHIFTPTEDTEVEVQIDSVNSASADIDALGASGLPVTWAQVIEIGATVVDGVCGLEYLDEIDVTSATASVAFGASGDGVTQRSLDGDVDEVYELYFYWPKPNLTLSTLEIHPDGVDVGANSNWDRQLSNGTTSAGTGWAICVVGDAGGGSTCHMTGYATIFAKTGKKRHVIGSSSGSPGDAANAIGVEVYSTWHDTSTNITGLTVINEADNLPVGTKLVLYRRVNSPLRADSASTYERNAEPVVDQGTAAEVEYHLGAATFDGYAVGISVRMVDDDVTSGSAIVRLKVGGTTVLTATLDSTNTTFARATANPGIHSISSGDDITVTVETSSLNTTGATTVGLSVNATMVNAALVRPQVDPQFASQLWYPPEVPSAYDDEFDSSTLDSKWSANGTLSGTAPTARAAFNDGTLRLDTNAKPSWMRIQNSSDGTARGIYQDFGGQVPVGAYYVRIKDLWNRSSIVNGDGNMRFLISSVGSGINIASDNLVGIQTEYDAGSFTIQTFHIGGAGTIRDTGTLQGAGNHYDYWIINYDGTNYDCYLAGADGIPEFFSTFTHAAALRYVHFNQTVLDQTTPGNHMALVDFFRYEADPSKLGL